MKYLQILFQEDNIPTVSVRELKQQINQLKRFSHITHRGHVMAFVPDNKTKAKNAGYEWAQLDNLAAEIGANWKKGLSAVKAISQGRR